MDGYDNCPSRGYPDDIDDTDEGYILLPIKGDFDCFPSSDLVSTYLCRAYCHPRHVAQI